EDALALRVRRRAAQGMDGAGPQRLQRVPAPLLAARGHRLGGQGDAVHHGGDEIALVLEMPVDRPARHARVARDVLERGPRDAVAAEDALGGVEYAVARFARVVLGPSDHGYPLCLRPLPGGVMENGGRLFTYIRDCM